MQDEDIKNIEQAAKIDKRNKSSLVAKAVVEYKNKLVANDES